MTLTEQLVHLKNRTVNSSFALRLFFCLSVALTWTEIIECRSRIKERENKHSTRYIHSLHVCMYVYVHAYLKLNVCLY